MKKLVCLISLAAFLAANAQDVVVDQGSKGYSGTMNKTFIWSIGIEPSIPLGHFNRYSDFGFGGSLQGEIKPGHTVGITINAGYIDYFGKTVNNVKYSDFKYWPVMGGLKLYMSKAFYAHAQAGPGFGTNGLGTSFWYGAGIGFSLSKAIDAEFKYTGWKQHLITTTGTTEGTTGGTTGGYGNGGSTGTGSNGSSGSGSGSTGGGYGGHYPTIGIRLAYNF